MILDVSLTRMELLRLKKKLTIARKGHKLLKDKLDELVRIMMRLIREIKETRGKIDKDLYFAQNRIALSAYETFPEATELALSTAAAEITITTEYKQLLNLQVPSFSLDTQYRYRTNYGLLQTTPLLDEAMNKYASLLNLIIQLAEKEKTAQLLATEIEKTRRRVNALEYIHIPNLEETISYISMKLEEQDRNTKTQLMRIKDVIRAPKAHSSAYPGTFQFPT